MPSVTKDKRNYGVSIGGTSGRDKKAEREREEARADEMRRHREARGDGNEFYFSGRVRPLIDD